MKKRKTSKQKGVLAVSVLLAGVIAAGGTFAWFTSQDEVVNQLSASNNYGVAITESFTPPSDWVPGQQVTKAVGAVNTGNVDAFVRLSVGNSLTLTILGDAENFSKTNTENYISVVDAERIALQAGGKLVCEAGSSTDKDVASDTYTPSETGLYIFQRTLTNDNGNEYVGYYYYKADESSNGVYYALDEITAPTDDGSSWSATIKTTKSVDNPDISLKYVDANESENIPAYIEATYVGEGENNTSPDDDIVIKINLAENWDDYWEYDSTNKDTLQFYYKKLLPAGETSENNLIASVELDSSVQAEAYYSFDYNLIIGLDSVQVTNDADKTTAVNAGWTPVQAAISDTGDITWTFTSASEP